MMNCETLQLNLSLYFDDILTSEELGVLDEHLKVCPLCRVKLSEIQLITHDLRSFSQVEISNNVTNTIRSNIKQKLQHNKRKPMINNYLSEFLQFKVMPYSVGTVASFLLFFAFISSFPTVQPNNGNEIVTKEIAYVDMSKQVREMEMPNKFGVPNEIPLTSIDYALSRSNFSKESPSVNPNGALIAFANTLVRDDVSEDEVVLVADVMSNGIAKITQIVEAPKNKSTMDKLEKALQNDADYAPFVPSNLDNRSENMQIILKMQTVEVNEKSAKKKRR